MGTGARSIAGIGRASSSCTSRLARVQGGRVQPRAPPLHRSTRGDHRPDRRRRPRAAPLPARDGLVLLATRASVSCRPSRATATSRAAPTTPPASTPSKPSTCRSCPRATSASRSRSLGRWGLFRRRALAAIGGWNEWCICEDTEASLRVLKDGWSGLYIPRCFGRGVVPPSFAGMLTQRHRWCFGAMQILRLHWRSLMPWDSSPDNHLTAAQRRDYLMASLGWFRDLLMLAFSLLLLAIAGLLVTHSRFAVSPLEGVLLAAPAVAHRDRHDLHVVHAAPLDHHVVSPCRCCRWVSASRLRS